MADKIDPKKIDTEELDVPSYYERNELRQGVNEFVDKIKSDKKDREDNAKDNFKKHIRGE